MLRICFLLTIISLVLVGCNSTKSFEGSLLGIQGDQVQVNCSSEINKGKKNVDSLGYICNIQINDKTKITDKNGKEIKIGDIPINSNLKIYLNKSVNLKKNRDGLIADKIIQMETK